MLVLCRDDLFRARCGRHGVGAAVSGDEECEGPVDIVWPQSIGKGERDGRGSSADEHLAY